MSEPVALLPCRWCGGKDVSVMHTDLYWVVCDADDCQAEGPLRATEPEAIAAWSISTQTDQQLREEVESIVSAWAFAHNIDGAARNDLFARLRSSLSSSSLTNG